MLPRPKQRSLRVLFLVLVDSVTGTVRFGSDAVWPYPVCPRKKREQRSSECCVAKHRARQPERPIFTDRNSQWHNDVSESTVT
uniref:Putative secreted protein n=1 Tax=Anopheles darlingi TaxID=43151 RepID=A0A2M4D294_ANODA